MAESLPGPYEIEFVLQGWLAPVRQHVIRFSVMAVGAPVPGSLPSTIDIQKMNATTAKLDAVANQIWEFLRRFYNTGITVVGYNLWRYVPGTLAKDFVSAGTVTNPAGLSPAAATIAHQVTLTYRSANGGILKIVLLETSLTGDTRTTLLANPTGDASQRLTSYIMSGDNVVLSRDDAYPVAPLRDARGQNEKIWRKVYRQ